MRLSALFLLLIAVPCFADTINAASCSLAHVQAAIDTAVDGDTVQVPSGGCTWSGGFDIPDTKGITLAGNGAANTIITTPSIGDIDTDPDNQPVRLTGFRFERSGSDTLLYILGTAQNWRIDNNIFDDNSTSGPYTIQIGIKGSETQDNFNYGVIDSNQFIGRDFATSIHVSWVRSALDPVASGDWIWSQTAQRGTARAVYIEDNTFSGDGAASQVVDTQYGGQTVVRYNTIDSPWISTHSGCTNNGRNTAWSEIYKNTFTENGTAYGGNQVEFRSTSGVIWDNTSSSTIDFDMGVDHERSYRTDCAGPYGGRADGTRAYDENAGLHGYRALGQPGWGPPQEDDMSAATFAGVFAWGNSNNGSPVELGIANNNPYTDEHIVTGRELFNEADVSEGVIASRSSTCDAGPAGRDIYISTDENSQGARIYICSATNTWTQHWEPYTYPHPLRDDTVRPEPPTNVIVTQLIH